VVSVLPVTLFGPYDALIGSGIFLLSIYRRKLPGVLKGGISTVHVLDAAEGHFQAMEKGVKGGRYILTGPPENNLYFRDFAGIIAEVLARRFPDRRFRRRYPVIPPWAAYGAAEITEIAARLSRRPGRLSRAVVRAGCRALFYSSADSIRELGYRPRRSFREAVEEMAEYYQAIGLFSARGRRIGYGA
jgi:dihydroflavonol-4-reductase